MLLVPGGAGHGGVLERFALRLADHHDVVTMTTRAASAQRGGTRGDQSPTAHAQDAIGLIDHLFDTPPIVFGFSSGAVTALELLARRPDRVRRAVVHEPPLVRLLPNAPAHRAALEAVRDAALAGDRAKADELMNAAMTAPVPNDTAPPEIRHTGTWIEGYADTAPEPPSPALLELFARTEGLHRLMLEHILVPFASHEPDPAVLRAHGDQLVPVAGVDSRGQLPHRAVSALAAGLGLPLTELPGGHLGPVERPTQFAAAFTELLATL
ncbi:alpha/beta hydrolase [Nocardiopsis sp. NPDC007018]|uniref:alpha/beta fold hydrolase n=1 Tax=Nocardiopsis sp. NPDC007018 TaxID=3155721 RepID=UPI0033EFD69D